MSVGLFSYGCTPQKPRELTFNQHQKVYYANHGSHGDFVLVWISLPRRWRLSTRPVAGSDYWLTSKLKRFIIQNVFNALLIPRHSDNPQAITEQMKDALNAGDSLIIFLKARVILTTTPSCCRSSPAFIIWRKANLIPNLCRFG